MINTESAAQDWLRTHAEATPQAIAQIETFIALLTQESAEQNLVSAASLSEVWQRHIVDSAQLLTHVPRETTGPWLDLGTGAGFPGLVVAALRPDLPVILVESRARRIDWLYRAIEALDLQNTQVIGQRLELTQSRPVSVISARAFAPLDKLIKLSARFSTADTIWLLPKGRSAAQELAELPENLRAGFHVEQSLTNPEAGIIIGHLPRSASRG
jgi:16S rRNA (guanine527-N7)-methyltransferase